MKPLKFHELYTKSSVLHEKGNYFSTPIEIQIPYRAAFSMQTHWLTGSLCNPIQRAFAYSEVRPTVFDGAYAQADVHTIEALESSRRNYHNRTKFAVGMGNCKNLRLLEKISSIRRRKRICFEAA